MSDIERLRAVAEAATPGVWKLWGMTVMADQDGTSNVDTAVGVAHTLYRDENDKPRTFDAEHIAAFDPPTVLALLGEVDRLRGWKAEALPVMAGLQDLGRALDLPLGEQITGPAALEAVRDLRNRLEAAEAKVARAEALSLGWACDVMILRRDAIRDGDVEADWHASARRQHLDALRAALSAAQDDDGSGGRRVAEGPGVGA